MRFNPKARLDTSRDARRGGGGGGGGGGRAAACASRSPAAPRPAVASASWSIVVVILLLKACGGVDLTGAITGTGLSGYDVSRFQGGDSTAYQTCTTGQDANEHPDTCGVVAVENSLVDYWQQHPGPAVAQHAVPAGGGDHDLLRQRRRSGCGQASSAMGPFYCPNDQTIYFDPTFFNDILQEQLNGPSGAFVEPYVIAHEYGHHIQNLLGTMGKVKTQQGPNSDSVRLELQADCYAGMWTTQRHPAPRTARATC